MLAVETIGLIKAYGGRQVVCDFNMHVRQGSIYGFVGKNGAGKSTVMKMIDSLVTPTSGTIKVFGSEIDVPSDAHHEKVTPSERRIGALIENPGILPNLSAQDNMEALALATGIVDAKTRTRELLRLVSLDDAGKKKAKSFSQGMKQRLGIAMALLGSPDLLLLDEPFNGLDPEGTRDIRNLIIRLNQMYNMTIVVSSHVLDQLDRMVTDYGVIANGSMVREMSAKEVQAECGESLRIRTSDPSRTLAQLEQRFSDAFLLMEPDTAIRISQTSDLDAIAGFLHEMDVTVLELSETKRDLEDYFVALMEGGASHA